MTFVELGPTAGCKQLHIVHAAAPRLSHQAREHLPADTCTAGLLSHDHLRDEGVKRPIADETAHPDQAAGVIPYRADDPTPGQSTLEPVEGPVRPTGLVIERLELHRGRRGEGIFHAKTVLRARFNSRSVYEPVGLLLFNVLGMVAEFEADLICARTWEGMQVAEATGNLCGRQPTLSKTK